MRKPALYAETFLISLAVILLEVNYTRVFSFKLVYYFSYLIIGISLLGLGAGGVFVAAFAWVRRIPPTRLIPACCLVASVAVLAGYFATAQTALNAFQLMSVGPDADLRTLRVLARFAFVCFALFVPFAAGGVALATVFSTRPDRIGMLYFADLLGAGIGCAICIPLMAAISPPGAVMVAGFCFALAAIRLSLVDFRALVLPTAAVAVACVLAAALPARLPDPLPDEVKTMNPVHHAPEDVLFSSWSPVFRVDVMRVGYDPTSLLLSHDGMWGSVIRRFDGNPATLARYDREERAYPFRVLKSAPEVLVIGSAGGNEILAALHFNAAHVTGVELNPVTNSLLTNHFADYSGHIAADPRVTLVTGEGRSFLTSSSSLYDLVWFVAPDSYAAMNAATSGAFVLSESYLYTAEMIVAALQHLRDGGIICTQFGEVDFDNKPNRTARYLATAREAFARLGIEDFGRHVLLSTTPGFVIVNTSTILLKKTPFTREEIARFTETTNSLAGARVRHAWTGGADSGSTNAVNQVISADGTDLPRWLAQYPFDIRPVTDDSPFFWHFVRFRDLASRASTLNPEEGAGERLLLALLVVAIAFALTFLLAPLWAMRDVWRAIPCKTRAGVYFAALGTGFMFFEVSLIQRLTLFLGYPTYSLTVTLFALLLSTGLGSLLSDRYFGRHRPILIALAGCLLALALFYQHGMTPIIARGVGWPLAVRVMVTIAFLMPLGACLGAFMPIGLRTVAALTVHGREFVAWCWAVNGFFSVVSSVLSTILSMTFGFNVVMLTAVVAYWVGIAALLQLPGPRPEVTPAA